MGDDETNATAPEVQQKPQPFPGQPTNMEQFSPMRPGMMPPVNGSGPPGMRHPASFPPYGQRFPNQNAPFHSQFGPPGGPANTTLPKPPIFDKDGQIWLEACSADGKVYYFNAKTRETRWDNPAPEESNKKEVKETKEQDSVENNTESSNTDVQMSATENTEVTEKKQDTSEVVSQNDQPMPEAQSVPPTNDTSLQPPVSHPPQLHPPGPGGPRPFPPQGMPPNLPPPFGMPSMMRPPTGIPPGFPGFPPRMPSGMNPPRFPPFPGFRMPPPDFVPQTLGDWTEHRLPDGRLYYYNNKSKESKWVKPQEFLDHDKEDKSGTGKVDKAKKDESDKTSAKKSDKVDSKKKPVASRPIPGTGWHLVWTGVGKVFFFNPTSKTSIWERPKELESNANVDEILKQGPNPPKEKVAPPAVITDFVVEKEKRPKETPKEDEEEEYNEQLEPNIKRKKMDLVENDEIKSIPMIVEEEKSAKSKEQIKQLREVEVKKAIVPLDERMTMFTNLLREKEVSAFSTFEKELNKILFDRRYLLLSMKERKQCYEKYVKVRAIEERKERAQKMRERKEDFKTLLEDVISSARITFSDFAAKNSKEPRYKAIEKMREREQLFNEFMTDFRKHEKEKLKLREQKLRKQFFELLSELTNLDENSKWKKVKQSIESDRRYELVGSSSKREQFFYEYIKQMLSKDEEASPTKETEEKEEDKDGVEEGENPSSPAAESNADQEKTDRVEASIRKREEEVRAQKELYEKDREKERGLHMHEKAVQHFRALLADMVKDTQFSWKETRRSLRKDPRWSALDILDKSEKETLFNNHIRDIKDKRKKAFRKLLDEADVPLDSHWREVRRQIKDDPRYAKFGTSELREEEFETYIREKLTAARTDFRELLRETKLITHKTKENPNHLKDVISILKKDKRYHVMSSLSSERERLIKGHVDDLYKRGPPPPPTATNPSSRYKKE